MSVTASVGAASFDPGGSLHDLYLRADRAMYASKTAGRNRVTGWTGEIGLPEDEPSDEAPIGARAGEHPPTRMRRHP